MFMEFENKKYVSDQVLMAVLMTLSLSWIFIIQVNRLLEDFIDTYVHEKKNSILFLRNKIKVQDDSYCTSNTMYGQQRAT